MSTSASTSTSIALMTAKYLNNKWGKENPVKVVNDISKGKLLPTQSLLMSKNIQYRYEIIKAGGIDKILEFVLQSNQDFKDVLPSASEEEEDEDDSLYVTCPSLWIEILSCFCKDGFLNSQSPASSSSPLQPLAAVQLEELQKEIQYKVMNNISGLFQDMSPEYFKSNNVTPKLFGSKDYWIKSLLPFSALLSNLLTSTSNNGTMGNFLIKQPKIKQFLLQITYLDFAFDYDFDSDNNNNNQVVIDIVDFQKKTDRSDNNRISKVDIIGSSQSYCAVAIKTLTDNAEKQAVAQLTTSSNVNNKKYALLGEFAVTPIIVYPTTTDDNDNNNNKNYGGSFLRFGTGLIALLENKSSSSHHDSGDSVSDGWYQGGGYSSTLYLFLKLYDWGGRISGKFIGINSCVSSNLVAICSKHIHIYTSKRKDQSFIENVSIGLVVLYASLMTPIIVDPKNTGQQRQAPIDYNVANAIYGGLMEYCLDVCDCCYNCNDGGHIITQLQRLLKIIYLTVQFPDTKKAIRSKEQELMAKVERVKDRLPYLFSCVPMIEKIINAVSTTTTTTTTTTRGNDNDDNNSTKNNNNKEFPTCECCSEKCNTKNKMSKKCSFCRSVIYCSSDCLQKNWPLHQKQCVIIRKYPTPKSKITIVEEGKEIFTEQIQKILLQASLKGFSILYCLVVIDMAESTPLLRTLTMEQFIQSYHINMAPDDDDILQKSKEIFERNKNDGSLTVSMIGFTEVGLSISVLTFPPDSVPMHLFDHSSEVQHTIETDRWPAAQRDVAGKSLLNADDGLKKLQSNPQLWQASLLKLMKP